MKRNSRQVTFSVSDWVYNTYLVNCGNNRSRWIEELIIKGAMVMEEDFVHDKQKIIQLIKKIGVLKEELVRLEKKNASLTYRLKGKDQAEKDFLVKQQRGWNKDNISNWERLYWENHRDIPDHFLHGQHRNYQSEMGVRITFEEFKRRYKEMKNT